MVGRDHEDVIGAHVRKELRQPLIEGGQRLRITVDIVSMSIKHIVVHQIDEAEPLKVPALILQGTLHSFRVSRSIDMLRNSLSGEDIKDFTHRDHVITLFLQLVQHVYGRRFNGKVMTAGRSHIMAAFPFKGTGDHPAHPVLSGENLPGDPAVFVQSFRRHDFFMGRDLEHAVRRGVYDELSCLHMLVSVVLYDLGTGVRAVAENASSGAAGEFIKDLRRKSIRIGGQGTAGIDAGNLPVADGGVFPFGCLAHAGDRCAGRRD